MSIALWIIGYLIMGIIAALIVGIVTGELYDDGELALLMVVFWPVIILLGALYAITQGTTDLINGIIEYFENHKK